MPRAAATGSKVSSVFPQEIVRFVRCGPDLKLPCLDADDVEEITHERGHLRDEASQAYGFAIKPLPRLALTRSQRERGRTHGHASEQRAEIVGDHPEEVVTCGNRCIGALALGPQIPIGLGALVPKELRQRARLRRALIAEIRVLGGAFVAQRIVLATSLLASGMQRCFIEALVRVPSRPS